MHAESPGHLDAAVTLPNPLVPAIGSSRGRDHREALERADAARFAAERSEARYRALVEASTTMVWTADRSGMILEIPSWPALTGQSIEQARGSGWLTVLHEDDRPVVKRVLAEANRTRRPVERQFRLRVLDGSYRWFTARAVPVLDSQGEIVEWVGTFIDIHERKRAEETLEFLGEASRCLLASLDLQATLDTLASLCIPRLGDFCHIDLVDAPGAELKRVATAHRDPAKLELLREMTHRFPPSKHPLYASATTARTGESRLVNDLDDLYYYSLAENEEHLRYIQSIAPRAFVAAPLAARGRVLGALVVTMAESGRRYTEQDLAVVDELARRAALAVDHARLYAAERRARSTAESASKAKSDFLAIMSHELRTPLNAILGYTDLIAGEIVGPVNGTQRNQLGRVKASANHLLELIEQVLTLSRLEVGREQVHRTPVDVPALCRDAVSLLEPAARNKHLHLDFAISGGIGTRVTDETKLRQILINLLANAVKFTEEGEVSLVVRGDGELLRFIVRDTGVGIEAEHLQHVFDPFWQVDTRRARRTSGSGLGLSVSRDLARLLGGEIEVESALGKGSTFTVRLPAAAAGT